MSAEKVFLPGLSGRYAAALFALAEESGALEAVEADLGRLEALLSESETFRQVTESPILSREEQGALVARTADALGIGDLVRRFLGVLARNRRLGILKAAIRDYGRLMAVRRGEVTAEVRSAQPLTGTQIEALKARLKTIAGRKVTIEPQVDASLIGGLVVKIGSRMIDGSVATKLKTLERAMKGA